MDMSPKASSFLKGIKGKKIGFIGIGVSHRDAIGLFMKYGANVTVLDRRSEDELGDDYTQLIRIGVSFITGDDYLDHLSDMDMVIRTPGMYFYNEKIQTAIKDGVIVTSEMELFFSLCPCPIYAVTGSDGKTTTTSLIAEMMKKTGKIVYLGGNIGYALLPKIEEISKDDIAVVELSSFQLLSMRLSPHRAVLTNIAPNHLDVHGTMEEYVCAKKNIFIHQDGLGLSIINDDNEASNEFRKCIRGRLYTFSRKSMPKIGAWCDENGDIKFIDRFGTQTFIMNKSEIFLPGEHNVENILAAICCVWGNISPRDIADVARNFRGVEHRMEYVRNLDGVKWYNDSIATSPTRTNAGLRAFNQKVILIAGGYDKHIPFEPLAQPVNDRVKALILTGDTTDKIYEVVKNYQGYSEDTLPIYRVSSLAQAVDKAREIACDGDIVTLSPACASFDTHKNFEERGKDYKNMVMSL